MASRAEEKARRRREREAREADEAKAVERSRRLRLLLIGGVVAAAGVVLVVALLAGGGGSSGPKPAATGGAAAIPARKVTDLGAAARTAGCTLRSYPQADRFRGHTTAPVRYRTNPPTFGAHNPTPASDGDYAGQGTPPVEQLVHSLEHGRVQIQYRPGSSRREVEQLTTLFDEPAGSYGAGEYEQLFQNTTGMPYAVAATAWGHMLACPRFDAGVFDAIRAFRQTYTLKAPEYIPQPE